jgi:cyclopropane-fatty-acyl-phospholipid synthase
MTVHDVLAEILYHGFEVLEVVGETRDYGLTMLEWAKRLDEARDFVVAGWGKVYQIHRLYL